MMVIAYETVPEEPETYVVVIVGKGLAVPPANIPPEVLLSVIEKLKAAFTVRLKVMLREIPLAEVPVTVMVCAPTGVSPAPPVNVVRMSAVMSQVGKHEVNENATDMPCAEVV